MLVVVYWHQHMAFSQHAPHSVIYALKSYIVRLTFCVWNIAYGETSAVLSASGP